MTTTHFGGSDAAAAAAEVVRLQFTIRLALINLELLMSQAQTDLARLNADAANEETAFAAYQAKVQAAAQAAADAQAASQAQIAALQSSENVPADLQTGLDAAHTASQALTDKINALVTTASAAPASTSTTASSTTTTADTTAAMPQPQTGPLNDGHVVPTGAPSTAATDPTTAAATGTDTTTPAAGAGLTQTATPTPAPAQATATPVTADSGTTTADAAPVTAATPAA